MFFYNFHCVSIHLIYWFVRLARELELAYKPVRYLVLLIVHEKSVLVSLIVTRIKQTRRDAAPVTPPQQLEH